MKSATIFGRSSFSVNKKIVVENLRSKCLCAQCLVYNDINLSEIKVLMKLICQTN